MTPPRFSAIVPVLAPSAEAATGLDGCLAALLACQPAPFEVVVVTGGSGTPVASPDPRVRVTCQPGAGLAAARNAGAAEATGDILVFVDPDILVPPDAFAQLASAFAGTPEAAAIWGTVTAAHEHPGVLSRYRTHLQRRDSAARPRATPALASLLAAVRREAFLAAGGFALVADRRPSFLAAIRTDLQGNVRGDFQRVRHQAKSGLARRLRRDPLLVLDRADERRRLRYLVGVPLGVGALGAALTGRWALSAGLAAALVGWESDLWESLRHEEGLRFALACVPLMALERTSVAAAVVAGTVDLVRGR